MKNPVIITGMYRSGGSMVAELLNHAGIFTGMPTDKEQQPNIFGNLNHWILGQTGATWDNPYNFRFLTEEMKKDAAKVFARKLKGKHLKRFWGKNMAGVRNFEKIDFDWGWFHPLNSFTTGIWQELFDGLTIIHVYRNPVDVAASLRSYNLTERALYKKHLFSGVRRRRLESRLSPKRIYDPSVRTLHLEEGFRLWVDYVEAANRLHSNSQLRIYDLCYEDFIGNFETEIIKLMSFLDFKLPDGMVRDLYQTIHPDRRYAFRNDDSLKEFYFTIRNHSEVIAMNYHEIEI
jgi:hypothetical protein